MKNLKDQDVNKLSAVAHYAGFKLRNARHGRKTYYNSLTGAAVRVRFDEDGNAVTAAVKGGGYNHHVADKVAGYMMKNGRH